MRKTYPLEQSPFYRLTTRKKLAALLGLSPEKLEWLANSCDSYRQWQAAQANGKVRDIQAPRPLMQNAHRRVATLLSRIEPPPFLFCPVKGRSYVSNATAHLGAAQMRTLDVKAYFPSTPSRRVFSFFRKGMECSPDVAAVLAKLLTVDGHLATGSAVSAIMAYYAFRDVWLDVADLVAEAGCKVTVYMDDVTISGPSVPEWLVWKIKERIHGGGLRYHKERTFGGDRAEITGVLLRDGRALVPNRQLKKAHELRMALRAAPDSETAETVRRKLAGLSAQRSHVEDSRS